MNSSNHQVSEPRPVEYVSNTNAAAHQVSEPRPVEYVSNTSTPNHQIPDPSPAEHQDSIDASDHEDSASSHQGTTYRLNEDGVWVQDDQAPDDDPDWTFVDDGAESSVVGNDDASEENRLRGPSPSPVPTVVGNDDISVVPGEDDGIRSHSPSFVSAHSAQDTITERRVAPNNPDVQSIASGAESSSDSWVTEGRSRAGSVSRDGSEASMHPSEPASAHSGRSGVVPDDIRIQGNVQSTGNLNVRNAGNGITISSSIPPNIGVSASIQSSNFVCNSGNGMRISSSNSSGRPGFTWQITPGISRGQSNVQSNSSPNAYNTAGTSPLGTNASISINGTQIPHNTNSQNGGVFRYQAFQGRTLNNATLSNCHISGCSGQNLKMTECRFSGCNFSNAEIVDSM
ncbi:hypothetical protein G7Y79_00010g028330 [Physcia stellaris]|nr:hypothetical protein G7Y79_00010g028330 [Physcia stellaris]